MTPLFAVLAPYFAPAVAGGGPIRSLDALTASAPPETRVVVVTGDRDHGSDDPLPVPTGVWTRHRDVPVLYSDTRSVRALARSFSALRAQRPDQLCLNSFFGVTFSLVPQLLGRLGWWHGAGVVVAPRGEFAPDALASKAPKKRAYLATYRLLGLHRRVLWHAATELEAAEIRALWGADTRIVVNTPRSPLPARAVRSHPEPSPVLRAVSFGRMTRLKGFDLVLRGLAELPVGTRMHLDVIGPHEEPDFVAECRRLAADLPDGITVDFVGALGHDALTRALQGYDVALLGTHGESYGHVVAEALAAGCPVVVGDTTPWTAAIAGGAGLVVPQQTPSAWAGTLARFVGLDVATRLAMRDAAADAFEEAQRAEAPHLFEQVLATSRESVTPV